jgi:hypothetical protein
VKVNVAPQAVNAPIKAGQPVGTIVIELGGEQIAKVPAVASVDVPKQSWIKKFLPF